MVHIWNLKCIHPRMKNKLNPESRKKIEDSITISYLKAIKNKIQMNGRI